MTARQKIIFAKAKRSENFTSDDRREIHHLVSKRWLTKDESGRYLARENEPLVVPPSDWIWLPNEIVSGAANEVPPVERLRQTQDVMTLQLYVDLYHVHNLREDAGIGHFSIRKRYVRERVGEHAQFVVWGFREDGLSAWSSSDPVAAQLNRDAEDDQERFAPFWPRLETLFDLGLFDWVPVLFDGDNPDAEPIHPFGMGESDGVEDRLGVAADRAGRAMLTDGQCQFVDTNCLRLAPVPKHMANVNMIGIARARYRPKTRATAAWLADLHRKGQRYIEKYAAIAGVQEIREKKLLMAPQKTR